MSGMSGMSRTGRGRGRARAEIAVVRVLEKRLGALPAVAEFGRRLRIAEIVDELCRVRPLAWITRALDAIAPQLDEITGGVGAAAVTEFGIDVSRLHWDLTSISLYGAYPEADQEYPAPRWGHPKDRRPDLRQIQTGLAVSG